MYLIATTLAVLSCSEEPKDYVVLSGKITNKTSKEFSINNQDRSFKKVIVLMEDGSFRDTIKTDPNKYILYDGKNRTYLYLENGKDISINYDTNDHKNTLNFSGTGSAINKYIVQKAKRTKEIIPDNNAILKLEPEKAKSKYKEVKAELTNRISNHVEISEDFKTKELRNINYWYLNNIKKYENNYKHRNKGNDLKISPDFSIELDSIDYDNEEDYFFSGIYNSLVQNHYIKKSRESAKLDSINESIAYLKYVGTSKNEKMRNDLLFNFSKNRIVYLKGETTSEFYKTFMKLSTNTEHKDTLTKRYSKLMKLAAGQPSPKFVDYENYAGGKTSLNDLKGKYVYIDIWATWCGPCKRLMPNLQEIEKEYHGKNIEFVSISVDQDSDHDKWKKMVQEKELGGIQLFADKSFDSEFVKEYVVRGIPRFILIDPQGNIVDSQAPIPTDKLRSLLNELPI